MTPPIQTIQTSRRAPAVVPRPPGARPLRRGHGPPAATALRGAALAAPGAAVGGAGCGASLEQGAPRGSTGGPGGVCNGNPQEMDVFEWLLNGC